MAGVVLVEDDQWIAECYQAWLAAAGHTVRHARDAYDAIELIDDHPPQIIILDLLLPYANGVQLLHTFRSHADLAGIPVVLCSSSLPDDMPDLLPYGVHTITSKSALSPAYLNQIVREATAHASV